MNNFQEQIKQIEDTKKLYHITDNYYKKNNTLYIRITRKKYNYFIIYNKKFYIDKYFNELLPYICDEEWVKKYSKYKKFQIMYFFEQIINE